jgi:hypothetical protein
MLATAFASEASNAKRTTIVRDYDPIATPRALEQRLDLYAHLLNRSSSRRA